jgi:hypothetical protein
MYLWKCWRDTRMLFIIAIGVALIVMPTSVLVLGTGLITDSGPMAVTSALFLVTSLMALAVGALGANEQFGNKTVQFLFTKPRTRAYLVWVNWAVGCAELLLVALINLLIGWLVLARYGKSLVSIGLRDLFHGHDILGELIYCLLLYCLTYGLTAVLRNGLHGLGASLITISFLQAAAIVMRARWQVHAPIPPEPIATLSPLLSKALWMLLGLLFVVAAQFVVERAEV